jgi:hypothetical protein
MNILLLCRRRDIGWGQASLVRAFERRGVQLTYLKDDVRCDQNVSRLVDSCSERPSLILHPELNFPAMPGGLEKIEILTACFQIDTYAYTKRRIRWSMLFDHPIVFHPGYEAQFQKAGHQGVMTMYHAASRDLFDKLETERIFDIGWVGRSSFHIHDTRRQILSVLASRFRINDWQNHYNFEEVAEIYRRSKIVVNIARDDFPQDANMRAFEAMAAGALLITKVPSELTVIGFEDGVHFVGYTDTAAITNLVRQYLSNEVARRRIAEAAREKVFNEHTYDCRANTLVQMVQQNVGKRVAPARDWSEGSVRMVYIDYFAAHHVFDCTYAQWRHLATSNLSHALTGGMLIGRAWLSDLRRALASIKDDPT